MTVSQKGNAIDTSISDGAVPLESILCTEELHRRPSRPPDYEKENRALVALAQALADSPRSILQTLADTILEVFKADSAGLSLLTTHDGGKRFHWPAIAGVWKPHIGGGTPRDFGPCGDVLNRNAPLLFRHFERRYTYFEPVTPPVEECLLVPFYVEGKAVGTIWAIAHDDRRKFDAEDLRQLVSLGRFASAAYEVSMALDAVGRLAAIVEFSDDAIISKDLNGIIQTWNGGAERLFGYTAQETIGQPVTMLIPPERFNEEPGILERVRRGERIDHYETVRRCKDGTLRNISLTVSPVVDARGQIVAASKIVRDITERKRAEAQIARFTEELEERVRERTQELQEANAALTRQAEELIRSNVELERFAYISSHDLQEPLRMISGFTQLLAKRYKGKLGDDADEFIGFVVNGANRMQQLIKDLLAYSRVSVRERKVEQVDFEVLWTRAKADLGTEIVKSQAVLTHDPLPTVRGDTVQLGQVLQNLLANALKFRGPEPARIHVSATLTTGDTNVAGKGVTQWVFSVRDNGIGIEPQYAERIFVLFQRLHTQADYAGTGIGLAICKRIVEAHGGRIWVESRLGHGATFYFSIPASTTTPLSD